MTTRAQEEVSTVDGSIRQQSWLLKTLTFRQVPALLRWLGIIIMLLAWQVAAATNLVDVSFSSSPSRVVSAGIKIFQSGQIYSYLAATGYEVLWGLVVILLLGIPVGLIIGSNRVLYDLTRGIIDILYAVPFVLFLPVIVFWFGLDNTARIVIVIWSGILPLVINTIAGVRSLDRDYRRVATVFCTSRLKFFYKVAFPATLPYILAGVRLAIGRALVGAIVSEFFMGSHGLGFYVQSQMSQFNTSNAMAAIVVLAVAALTLNSMVSKLQAHFAHWAQSE